jgi:tetratricopeptide (TPR) repeat protein
VDAGAVWQWAYPAAAIGGLVGLWLLRKRIGRGPFVAGAFFVGTLFPALGFANVYPHRYSFVADHFQHLASLGPIVVLAVLVARWPVLVRGIVVTGLGVLTLLQARIYREPLTLWTDTLAKNPNGWMVHVNLGLAHRDLARSAGTLAERERHESAAAEHMIRAGELGPGVAEAVWNAGVAWANRGEMEEAERLFTRALEIDGKYAPALNSLGLLELKRGEAEKARELLERAVELQPGFPAAHANLGEALGRLGRTEAAAREYAAALSLDGGRARWRVELARLVARLGHEAADEGRKRELLSAAMGHYTQAITQDPRNAAARWELAGLLEEAGRGDLAGELRSQAMRLDPGVATRPVGAR